MGCLGGVQKVCVEEVYVLCSLLPPLSQDHSGGAEMPLNMVFWGPQRNWSGLKPYY